MKRITVKKGQSLLDISLQEYGTVGGVFDIVERNALQGITDNVREGDVVEVSGTADAQRIRDFLKPYDISTLPLASERAGGIGWMRVGHDFVIA